MKPLHTLLFLIAIGALSLAMAWVTPKKGFVLNDEYTLKFASLEEDTATLEPIKKIEDVVAFLEELEIDSTEIKDSIQKAELARRIKLSHIQWPEDDRSSMFTLFDDLEKVKTKKTKARIMHYGDSQIEGDRITSIIRNEIQKYYGGTGPGIIPVVEGVSNASIIQKNSNNWNRFTLFGRPDTNIKHRRYGPLCSFGMYTYPTDSNLTETQTAWVDFGQSGMTYWNTKQYSQAYLYYGHAVDSFTVTTSIDGELFTTETYPPTSGFSTLKWNFKKAPKHFKVEFSSIVSPEFYAFSFEGSSGVTVDNIGLRGSSGTLFKRLDGAQLRGFMKAQPIDLFILQFGGNTVPYIKSEKKAIGYGNWFRSQIKYLMKLNPNTAFIVIGPSDMATKIDGEFTTFPYLEMVRDVLKKAAFESGAGYWDLYEVMGGKNSMVSWAEAEKPLAGKDYVHFNSLGTRKVSELFMKAFWHEKDLWEQSKASSQTTTKTDSINVE